MSWERISRFQVIGFVERKFVPPSGKCAFLTLSVPGKNKDQKLEMVTFELIEDVGSLGVGQTVQVKGTIGIKPITNKAKENVEVDGRAVWVPQLIITKLDVQGAKDKPADKPTWGDEPEKPKSDAEKAADKREDSLDW